MIEIILPIVTVTLVIVAIIQYQTDKSIKESIKIMKGFVELVSKDEERH